MRALVLGSMALLATGFAVADKAPDLSSEKAKLNYFFGYQVGSQLGQQGLEFDDEIFMFAVKQGAKGEKPLMSEAEARILMQSFQQRQQEAMAQQGQENLKAGEAFLAENKKKDGIKTLESGLQYEVVKSGDGDKPKATDTVRVHYRGTLIDGTEFDSSYSRNAPAEFPVNRVIAGWTEILQLMPVGSHWKVYIPGSLAYGERGSPPKIAPNSVLVFDIELLEIKAP